FSLNRLNYTGTFGHLLSLIFTIYSILETDESIEFTMNLIVNFYLELKLEKYKRKNNYFLPTL
ncbi:hypothetical protein, partial [Thermoclostridium stercorarium]|uniref:hypothetical protein n=1 Tax=Thermoclostridium stercorarium TaxID=1510 RepID=UPI000B266E74